MQPVQPNPIISIRAVDGCELCVGLGAWGMDGGYGESGRGENQPGKFGLRRVDLGDGDGVG